MAQAARAPLTQPQSVFADFRPTDEGSSSGLSWAAVIGGAFVAAAVSIILLVLGTGVGLSSISPWSSRGSAAEAVTVGAIVWLTVSQILASTMGGYLAGRLRTKWVNIHTDEVFFRDTAHGFLVWAVGLVITAAFIAIAATSIAGRAAQGNTAGMGSEPNAYFIDSLFRSDTPNAGQYDNSVRLETGAIFVNDLRQPEIPAADKSYLGKLVAARTGLSQADAEQRVSDVFAQARQSADAARKAGAHLAYWTFFALLVGAFCASFAATVGGDQRDHVAVA